MTKKADSPDVLMSPLHLYYSFSNHRGNEGAEITAEFQHGTLNSLGLRGLPLHGIRQAQFARANTLFEWPPLLTCRLLDPLITAYRSLRCRILAFIRRLRLPILRRPLPVFFTPTVVSLLPENPNFCQIFQPNSLRQRNLSLRTEIATSRADAGNSRLLELYFDCDLESGPKRESVPGNPQRSKSGKSYVIPE
ncbi:MAG: hypothetical protein JWM11_6243 [Planctomycetaceae bacterium]|nr:hypothetical protein [Planctomycetaceae bacterium]